MIIKCTLRGTRENIEYLTGQFRELTALPESINKLGPYLRNQGEKDYQIVALYEFDQSEFSEAWEYLSEQSDAFRVIPEYSLAVTIFDKGSEVEWYRIIVTEGKPKPGIVRDSRSFTPAYLQASN